MTKDDVKDFSRVEQEIELLKNDVTLNKISPNQLSIQLKTK